MGVREPAIKNRIRVLPPDPDIPDYERWLASYSAVMAVYRTDSVSDKSRFGLSDPSALRSYEELAGIRVFPQDEETRPRALSWARPAPGHMPTMMFNPDSVANGTLAHRLAHELFHTASPLGTGLCVKDDAGNDHAQEILANRFAVEITHPAPWVVQTAEGNGARVLDSPFALEEVMRTSSRRMFAITIPVDGSSRGSIVLQAGGSPAHGGCPDPARSNPTWDDLAIWSKPGSGEVAYFPPNVSWKPELVPTETHGFVNFQTVDGLYHVEPLTAGMWSIFTGSGIVEPERFTGLAPGTASFDLWNLPEIALEDHGVVIEGGRYLVVHMLRIVISISPSKDAEDTLREMHQLFAVRDDAGHLHQAWERVAGTRTPCWGPLLPAMDPQRHAHLAPFDNWWLAGQGWREITFDLWSEMVAGKFLRDLTPDEEADRQTREEAAIEADRNGMSQPGFLVRKVQDQPQR